jgi:hypothetical protein
VDVKKIFFPDPDPTETLISDPDPDSKPDPAFFFENTSILETQII